LPYDILALRLMIFQRVALWYFSASPYDISAHCLMIFKHMVLWYFSASPYDIPARCLMIFQHIVLWYFSALPQCGGGGKEGVEHTKSWTGKENHSWINNSVKFTNVYSIPLLPFGRWLLFWAFFRSYLKINGREIVPTTIFTFWDGDEGRVFSY